jgi:hypothetical protein
MFQVDTISTITTDEEDHRTGETKELELQVVPGEWTDTG